jgi:hypothetical protein
MFFHIFHNLFKRFFLLDVHAIAYLLFVLPVIDHFVGKVNSIININLLESPTIRRGEGSRWFLRVAVDCVDDVLGRRFCCRKWLRFSEVEAEAKDRLNQNAD